MSHDSRAGNMSTTSVDSKKSKIDTVDKNSFLFIENFFNKASCYRLVDHIPKQSRIKFSQILNSVVKNICDLPSDASRWFRLLFLPRFALRKEPRGGRCHNIGAKINSRLDLFDRSSIDEIAKSINQVHGGERDKVWKPNLNVLVRSKMEQGNIRNAMKILSSTDTVAPNSVETLNALKGKHPSAPFDRNPSPDKEFISVSITSQQLLFCLRQFPKGTSGGRDGMTAQHLKDLLHDKIETSEVIASIVRLINLLLSGVCPSEVVPYLFGGRLVALTKKDGGVRPIAIGCVWRHWAAKCALLVIKEKIAPILGPQQVGVGVSGGAEGAIHAVRRFVSNMNPEEGFLKLDFSNAFNSLRRDHMLRCVKNRLPEIYNFCWLAYDSGSFLSFGGDIILSAEGVQQGDPLGPLLFSLSIDGMIKSLKSKFAVAYLDDIALGGCLENLVDDIKHIINSDQLYGLKLNINKCELTTNSVIIPNYLLTITKTETTDLQFLGSIIFRGKCHNDFWVKKLDEFKYILSKMALICKHDALVLLTQAAFVPRLSYFLRTSPSPLKEISDQFDCELRVRSQSIFNIFFDDKGWRQALLPVCLGGLGLGVVADLAPSAFLSSAAATATIQNMILPQDGLYDDLLRLETYSYWCSLYGDTISIESCSQKKWNEPSLNKSVALLEQSIVSPHDKARMMAVKSEFGSAWLRATPSTTCGTRLDNAAIRVSLGLRLGLPVVSEYECLCGTNVGPLGYHGLSCKMGSGRQARHTAMNDYLFRLFTKANIPSVKEPAGLMPDSNGRPDGYTLIPWSQGCCLTWDVTFPHTLAERYINYTSIEPGSAAVKAADFKHSKYKVLNDNTKLFVPICIETFGPTDKDTQMFFNNIGAKIVEITGDPNDKIYIKQNVSLLLQKFNSFCILENISKCPSVRDPKTNIMQREQE